MLVLNRYIGGFCAVGSNNFLINRINEEDRRFEKAAEKLNPTEPNYNI